MLRIGVWGGGGWLWERGVVDPGDGLPFLPSQLRPLNS